MYRSTANVSAGETLYTDYSSVTEEHLALRNIVLARKMPRRMFVQPHTCIGSGETIHSYHHGYKFVIFIKMER